jgi:dTDP-4-amino-4,6-dideoxygalactose transaminase
MEFIDLKTQRQKIKKSLDARLARVLDHGHYILGPEVAELEAALALYAGAAHCLTCSSGTDALLLALMARGVGPGDAVFTTPFTFMATAEVVALLGAVPVFVDIDPVTFTMDPAKLAEALAGVKRGGRPSPGSPAGLRPRGILPVDLFGHPADYDVFNRLAADEGLFVLEDAAQSFGAVYKGRKAGALASLAATSFFPAKPLGCYGDGGAVFTDDARLFEVMKSLRVHGQGPDKYTNVRIGLNARLDTLQAAVLLEKLLIFEDEIAARNRIAARYTEGISDRFVKPRAQSGVRSAWAQYSLRTTRRDAVTARLRADGIPTMVYYPTPLHRQEAFAYLRYPAGSFPISETVAREIFSLPLHPYLTAPDQERIITAVNAAGGA